MELYLKTILLCYLLFGQVGISAQADVVNYKKINITLQMNGTNDIKRIKKEGVAANEFDIPAFINEYIGQARIQIFGTFRTEGEKINIRFDSNDFFYENSSTVFCEEIVEIEQLPLLGVSTIPTVNFEGTQIKKVISGSAAEKAGLLATDIITAISVNEIHSDCDLVIAIQDNEIGEEVQIEYIRAGEKQLTTAKLGYQLQKKLSWLPCQDKPTLTERLPSSDQKDPTQPQLEVFPNPSNGVSFLQYQSSEIEAVDIIITDLSGRETYRQEVNEFDGFHNQYIDLTSKSAGIYFINVIQGAHIYTKKLVIQKK